MECKIILRAESQLGQQLGLKQDVVFESKQEFLDKLNQDLVTKYARKNLANVPGVSKMTSHLVSNVNAGIQQDATHSTEGSNVILPSQMFNAFTFKGYSQREVNEIYEAIADIAVRGLSDTFFADERKLSDIVASLVQGGMSQADAEAEAAKRKNGEEIDFSQLIKTIVDTDDKAAKDKMLAAYREILLMKKEDDNSSLFDVLTETFDAIGLPIDNPHMFNAAVSELSNKFTKEAIKIKFDGQFAVLKPGSGSQQVYEISGGRMPYKSGMDVKYRDIVGTQVVTRPIAERWAAANGVDLKTIKPRNLRGQYVTLVNPDGTRTQLTMAEGDSLIPEGKALSKARDIIDQYKAKSEAGGDLDKLFKEFSDEVMTGPDSAVIMPFIERFVNAIPEGDLAKEIKSGDTLNKIFFQLNPEAAHFEGKGMTSLKGDAGKLLFLGKVNTLQKVLSHEINNFMREASEGKIPQSLQGQYAEGSKIEVSRAEVLVDLTARDKFMLREGDDIVDIDEEFFLNRLSEKAGLLTNYHGAERMLQSGEQKIFFHYGSADKNKYPLSDQAEHNDDGTVDIYGTDEGGTGRTKLFSLKGKQTSVHTIDGDMHIYLGNHSTATAEQKQMLIQGSADSNYKRVFDFLSKNYKVKEADLTKATPERRQAKTEELAKKAREMFNSWNKYLDVIGTRIPGQHYQSFQGLRIVGFVTGNKIIVPNEITMLAGSDFDIDKMNMIYYSIDNDGTLSKWHPAADYSSRESMELSMRLPLPTGKGINAFLSERVGSHDIDDLVTITDQFDINNLEHLVLLYDSIKMGKRLPNTERGTAIANRLVELDDKEKFKVTAKGINNFTISRANAVINNPKNYPLLQKAVSMASPQLMGSMSKEGKDAKNRSKEQPSSTVLGKYDNMVGKDMIGIVASTGLKALSGMTAVYNKALMDLSTLSTKRAKLQLIAQQYPDDKVVKDRLESLKEEIDLIKDGFSANFSLANINFENVDPSVLSIVKPRFRAINMSVETDIAKQYIIQNMMEGLADDAAEIDSELLSAATDNAKELILSKIRATPEFGTIYTALIAQGVPFWSIVQTMTNPATDFYIKHFDREPFKAKHLSFVSAMKLTYKLMMANTNHKFEKAGGIKLRKKLMEDFGLEYKPDSNLLLDKDGVEVDVDALGKLKGLLDEGKSVQILGKYLGINQGIKAKPFELYTFTKTIESHILEAHNIDFSFTKFLNSLNGDKSYAETVIRDTNGGSFNLLYVLSRATNFEKQLQGFNVTNQMLRESTYKLNAAYAVTNALESLAINRGGALNEDQFNEVQRYVDNTVLLQFFNEETKKNNDPRSRPVFYDGDNRIELTTARGRKAFSEWVHDKFIPSVKRMKDFENNEFIRDLTYESVNDYANSEKVSIVRMTYDTTNAIAEETKSKADNYKFHLNELRHGFDTDPNSPTTNNIFNVLFWYNTLVNKGGTGKYSWAKMQNELILNDANHPFRRLAQLQGELGKDTTVRYDSPTSLKVNGIPIDLLDLMTFHNIKDKKVHTNLTPEEVTERNSENDEDAYNDYLMEMADQYEQSLEEQYDYDDETGESNYVPLVTVTKNTQKGVAGTKVYINQGKTILINDTTQYPSITIPYDINKVKSEDLENRIPAEDSGRAIREFGARLQAVNPQIELYFANKRQLANLSNSTKFDYTKAKAFILNGRVNINLDKASISDVVHEYGHLFLHALKYESSEMYDNLIQLAANHPRRSELSPNYQHLNTEDFNEEVFVTIFGESMQRNLTQAQPVRVPVDEIEFAKIQVATGQLAWDGDRMNPRVVLEDIEWKDIRKGSTDLMDGKMTAAAKRLVAALDVARKNKEYKFITGSGSMTELNYVPITEHYREAEMAEVEDNKKLFDPEDKELKKGAVVLYKKEKYLFWNENSTGKAQLIKPDGTKFSGTPNVDKLEVLGNYITTMHNNTEYIVTDNGNIYSGATGKLVYTGLDNSSLMQRQGIIASAQRIAGAGTEVTLEQDADNKELMLNFADYSKGKIKEILNREIESVLDMSPREVMNLTLEDAINLIGDDVMKNRIDNIYNKPIAFTNEIARLKDDLLKLGLLKKNCG